MDELRGTSNNSDWLNQVLEETGLQKFHSKLTNDLQLTKSSHFDFVSEEDLIQLGLSRPAAKRLLAAIKKRKSIVTAIKNRLVSKLIPTSTFTSSAKNKHPTLTIDTYHVNDPEQNKPTSEFGRLTCLINSQDIHIKEEIGNGVHGFVKKGEWTTPNGRVVEVALKILKKDVMSEPGASFNDFVKEISVMHQLNHPNIIKLYGVVLSSPMMMVTELAPFGNLRDKLRKENGCTPISQLINFGVQIASGMQYLESKRFVHRDLATRNIFISHGKKILIGDLGLMRAVPSHDDHYVMSERTKIPYPWCAPESLKFKQFSSSSDIYMFGVTLWEMFSFGKEPWAGLNLIEILENISSQKTRLACPEACPTMVYQTLLQCWNTDPGCRPNFATLYQYLSTSYPLEVRSTQHISETSQKRINGSSRPEDLLGTEPTQADQNESHRKVLECNVDDRILVIDGQPEKYWWKGQNQRTFEIGWFPLSSTRWLAPKRGTNYISKPLKNSFIHTGHCGPDGKWGNPMFIDSMYLKNPLEPGDLNNFKADIGQGQSGLLLKGKTKSRLSKLFGISDSSHSNQLLQHAYFRFKNEPQTSSKQEARPISVQAPILRSQSGDFVKSANDNDSPPLIDFDSDIPMPIVDSQIDAVSNQPQKSLIDMDISYPPIPDQRRASDTKIDQIDDDYQGWAGSWNTGTFYGSNTNIYSNYYCPQDAAESLDQAGSQQADCNTSNRYYSSVSQE